MTHRKHVVGGGKLDVGHVHQLLRLLAEAREIPAGGPEREQHLTSGVARIVGATVGAAILDPDFPDFTPEEPGRQPSITMAGWDGAALRPLAVPLVRAMMRITTSESGTAVTATWNELSSDPRWCGSERVELDLHPAWFVDALFSSVRLRAPSHVHGLSLYRERGSRPFGEEERNLVCVFHGECRDLLHAPPHDGDDDGLVRARLSPRQRQTLALVLHGLCDKEIAERLGISRYTVNQYTKVIYRYYAVTSRAQLLARMLTQPHASSIPNHRD